MSDSQIVLNPEGAEKMSDVLTAYVEPYVGMTDSPETYRKLLQLGTIAWNIALLPSQKRSQALDELLAQLPATIMQDWKQDLRKVIEELIARKDAHFADNHRAIVDFSLEETRDGYHLVVASTLATSPG